MNSVFGLKSSKMSYKSEEFKLIFIISEITCNHPFSIKIQNDIDLDLTTGFSPRQVKHEMAT